MDNGKIFKFMTKMYAEMQDGFKSVNERLSSLEEDVGILKGDVGSVKEDVGNIKVTVAKIEVEHGQKLSALFDGYVQNSEKLDRIETEVAKHDEFIIKRIK